MNDLILETRLETLERNLRQSADILNRVKNSQISINTIHDYLTRGVPTPAEKESALASALSVERSIRDFKGGVEGDYDLEEYLKNLGLLPKLTDALDQIEKVKKMIKDASEKLQEMQSKWVNVDVSSGTKMPGAIAVKNIQDQAENCQVIVKKIRTELDNAKEKEKGGKKDEANQLRNKAWEIYSKEVYPLTQDLFSEYVDFLRGIAMRHAGLDDGICQLADELISRWNIADMDQSLAIPAKQETVNMTLARIIRLGFPEWTIWALPLAAHELGHVVVNQKLKDFVKEQAPGLPDSTHLQELLADAFATFVMGPAYAYSVLLLRLNPPTANQEHDGQPSDAQRAYVIFDILDWLDAEVAVGKPFAGVLGDLKKAWGEALVQVNLSSDGMDPKIDGWLKVIKEKKLLLSAYSVPFTHIEWNRAVILHEALRPNEENKEPDPISPDGMPYNFVDVLNAAWLCRIAKPDTTQAVEARARVLWNGIMKVREGASPGLGKKPRFRPT